jgi:hypothetical protein
MGKRFLVILVAVSLVIGFTGLAIAAKGNGTPDDQKKIFQFNIIGKKNNDISGDTSNGKTIMIPLKTQATPNYMQCGEAQNSGGVKLVDDVWPNWSSEVPANNARLNFVVCDDCTAFAISDRDAIDDGNATIQVPASLLDATTKGILFDVYIRVMGKPLQCMEINGYAYDVTSTGTYYYNSGTVYLSKKAKTTFMKINDLFDVFYCDPGEETCTNEISVFADVFEGYFWELYNDGTKVVQVRIYAQPL